MKWEFELVKAKHRIGSYMGYHDDISNVTVPLFDERIIPQAIVHMEEWCQGDKGLIFMDINSGRAGFLIRGKS